MTTVHVLTLLTAKPLRANRPVSQNQLGQSRLGASPDQNLRIYQMLTLCVRVSEKEIEGDMT